MLLATAMQIQYLDLFLQLEEANDTYVPLVETQKTIQSSPSPEKMKYLEDTAEYTGFMRSYESICGDTRASKHGVNTQFWRNYIDMVDIYIHSIELYKQMMWIFSSSCLGKLLEFSLLLSRHNYACYMFLYYLRLLNRDTTHPGIKQQLEQEGFICEVVIQFLCQTTSGSSTSVYYQCRCSFTTNWNHCFPSKSRSSKGLDSYQIC